MSRVRKFRGGHIIAKTGFTLTNIRRGTRNFICLATTGASFWQFPTSDSRIAKKSRLGISVSQCWRVARSGIRKYTRLHIQRNAQSKKGGYTIAFEGGAYPKTIGYTNSFDEAAENWAIGGEKFPNGKRVLRGKIKSVPCPIYVCRIRQICEGR